MKNKQKIIVLSFIFLLIYFSFSVSAMINPSAVYCKAMGYEYVTESTSEGDIGYCIVDGQKIDSWKFLTGEEAQEYSYCSKQGYSIKTIEDRDKCIRLLSEKCAICVVDGKEIEMTYLMGLNFEEGGCGDGVCGISEDYKICPKDCRKQFDVIGIIITAIVIILGVIALFLIIRFIKNIKKKNRREKREK